VSTQPIGPRSLNISVRKRENDRIERENHAFAKRLFENSGSIPQVGQLEQEFMRNQNHKTRVMRVKKALPGLQFGQRATQLPPLHEDINELKGQGEKHMASRKNFNSNSKSNFNNESSADIKQEEGDNAATTNDQEALAIEDQEQEDKVQPAMGKKESQKSMAKNSNHEAEYEQATAEIEAAAKVATEGNEEEN